MEKRLSVSRSRHDGRIGLRVWMMAQGRRLLRDVCTERCFAGPEVRLVSNSVDIVAIFV